MTETQTWLAGSVTLYMLAMLAIGFWAGKKIKDTADYIVAGNRLGWWLSIGTIFATWFGAETCMGASRTAFEKGILGVIADPFGAGLCLVLSGVFFVKFFYKMKAKTIIDYFEMRYGTFMARTLSLLYIPVYVGWVAAQVLAFGVILHSLTGIPDTASIVISTAVVILYTYWGGMWAVTVTDFVQMIILIAGFVVLFPILFKDIGGFAVMKAKLPDGFFRVYPGSFSPLDWLNYLQAWMLVGIGSLPGQDLFQRIMAPKNMRIARWSSIYSGILYVLIGLLPVFLGMMGRVVLPGHSGDAILIDLSVRYLPTALIAVMIGALLSAIMSTVSSALLAPAGIIGHNIVPALKPDAGEALKLKWCKRSIWIVGVGSLAIALYFKDIYLLCTQSWGILLVGVAAPMIAGVYWKRANTYGAIAGAVTGTLAWIVLSLFLGDGYPNNLFGFLISCVSLVAVSFMTQGIQKPLVPEVPKNVVPIRWM